MIDWNLLGLSFITVFLAELGDKSQFAAIALSGSAKSAKAVFFGSVTALILASLIGVLFGEAEATTEEATEKPEVTIDPV
jgi:putative Ca2+/H+ antiporter (TMEM165/GDT1 family)